MTTATIADHIRTALPEAACEPIASVDFPTLYVARESLVDTCRFLRDDLGFVFLAELTAVDYWPKEPRFEVVYHLVALDPPQRLRLKVPLAGDDARVSTVSALWPAAGWPEREVYDLFGIAFDRHPELRRILMPDDWEGHPLRKDYPVQIKLPVRTDEPVQLTEEEFRANLQRDRAAREGKR